VARVVAAANFMNLRRLSLVVSVDKFIIVGSTGGAN